MVTNCNSQGYKVELGTKEPVLAEKWLSWWARRFKTSEEFFKAVQDWHSPDEHPDLFV